MHGNTSIMLIKKKTFFQLVSMKARIKRTSDESAAQYRKIAFKWGTPQRESMLADNPFLLKLFDDDVNFASFQKVCFGSFFIFVLTL
jgi:hypothetical protein